MTRPFSLFFQLAVAALLLVPSVVMGGTTVSGVFSLGVSPAIAPPLTIAINPASATVACAVAPGTVVSSVTTSGGDGNQITFSTSGGDASLVLSLVSPTATNIVIAANGVLPADCGHNVPTLIVSASQS